MRPMWPSSRQEGQALPGFVPCMIATNQIFPTNACGATLARLADLHSVASKSCHARRTNATCKGKVMCNVCGVIWAPREMLYSGVCKPCHGKVTNATGNRLCRPCGGTCSTMTRNRYGRCRFCSNKRKIKDITLLCTICGIATARRNGIFAGA